MLIKQILYVVISLILAFLFLVWGFLWLGFLLGIIQEGLGSRTQVEFFVVFLDMLRFLLLTCIGVMIIKAFPKSPFKDQKA